MKNRNAGSRPARSSKCGGCGGVIKDLYFWVVLEDGTPIHFDGPYGDNCLKLWRSTRVSKEACDRPAGDG